jgi:tryptophan-rich sensory protein
MSDMTLYKIIVCAWALLYIAMIVAVIYFWKRDKTEHD